MSIETWHGTPGGYTNHHCRCDGCRSALREYQRVKRAQRIASATPDRVHGTANGYGNYGCRCDRCRAAWTENESQRRNKRRSNDVA
jgi:hypothetical protein